MPDSNFISAKDFTFRPFPHPLHPDEVGDSGAMELATSKADPGEQYVIKRNTYPEIACNEFMYHKVTAALGLYTQDVKLIVGSKDYRRSAAIRYVPNAKIFSLKTSGEENFRAFFQFEALFVILNEDDSHEYYLDGQGRMFKLDNAAAFTVQQTTILLFDGNPLGRMFIPDINSPLNYAGYDWYGIKYREFTRERGQTAVDAYLSMIQKFSEFDETVLYEAYSALDKQYPKALSRYYDECIRIRKETCRKFLNEIKD
ncbi:MAG: hypothetical protein FWC27_04890 [Firmicutes bacterium]|nr:hypothetical protein [Bacillota bacterium]